MRFDFSSFKLWVLNPQGADKQHTGNELHFYVIASASTMFEYRLCRLRVAIQSLNLLCCWIATPSLHRSITKLKQVSQWRRYALIIYSCYLSDSPI